MASCWDVFEVKKRIGKGGMANVYLAHVKNSNPKEWRALKVLRRADEKEMKVIRARFYNEVQNHKKINSPYVIKIYETSFDNEINKNCELFMALEYCDGEILTDKIRNFGRILEREAVDITIKLCNGYGEIHNNNIVHRDIKSSNIMIAKNKDPKIIDFGISLSKDSQRVTKMNNVIGTPAWFAPEILDNQPPSIHSDIYSLGIVLYEMISGKLPYNSIKKDQKEIIRKIKNEKIPDLKQQFPNISNGLCNVIKRATARNPKHRYNTMFEFASDLKTCLNENRINEPDIDVKNLKPKKTFASVVNSVWFIILAALFVVILLGVVGGIMIWKLG